MDKFCRLCLSMTSEDFIAINNSIYQKQIEIVIPELNMKSIQAPLLCRKCSIALEAAFDLKTHSLRIDKYLSVFVDIMQTDVIPVSEILNIKVELDGDLSTEPTDNISLPDIPKIEENTVLHDDDACVDMKPSISSSVKDEPEGDLTKPLDKENYPVDLNNLSAQQCLVSREDLIVVDDLNEDIKCHKNITQQQNHGHRPTKPSCTICKKKCTSETSLKNHMFRHKTANTEYVCIVCGIKIIGKAALSVHYNQKHWGKNAHPCKICTRRFIQISDLEEHVLTHLEGQFKEVVYESDPENEESKEGIGRIHKE